jgi:hypothetical protein
MSDKREFLFIDESGDPGIGPGSNPTYLIAGVHLSEKALEAVRLHLACFRYHHAVTKELKNWGSLLKDRPTQQYKGLLFLLAELTTEGLIAGTVTWSTRRGMCGEAARTWVLVVRRVGFGTSRSGSFWSAIELACPGETTWSSSWTDGA